MDKEDINALNAKLEIRIRQIIEEETSKGLNINLAGEIIEKRVEKLRHEFLSNLESGGSENHHRIE